MSRFIAALFIVALLGGCRTFDRKKIEAELWLIDTKDLGLYRNVEINGEPKEEFYSIPGNPKLMKRFACAIDTTRQNIYEYIEKSCTCQ